MSYFWFKRGKVTGVGEQINRFLTVRNLVVHAAWNDADCAIAKKVGNDTGITSWAICPQWRCSFRWHQTKLSKPTDRGLVSCGSSSTPLKSECIIA